MQEYQSLEQPPMVEYGLWVLAILLLFAVFGVAVLLTITL